MSVAAGLLAFLLILTVLILVHEAGHFTVARLFGIRVDEFGLGFPPRIRSWQRSGVVYSINAIPLGGFVRMYGENGEFDRPDSFGAKAPWKRLCVLAAGPAMNLALALAIFFFAYVIGSPRGISEVTAVAGQSPAAAAHIRPGDRIVAIDGRHIEWFDQVEAATQQSLGKPLRLTILRAGRRFDAVIIPRANPPRGQGPMGVTLSKSVTVAYGPFSALRQSFGDVGTMIASVPDALGGIFGSHGSQVEGPIGIARTTTDVVGQAPRQGPGTVLQLAALLSANLGVLNLLPIPALDGGRIAFVLLAWVRRRSLDPQVEGMIHALGMAALFVLILFVSYQDVARWISGSAF